VIFAINLNILCWHKAIYTILLLIGIVILFFGKMLSLRSHGLCKRLVNYALIIHLSHFYVSVCIYLFVHRFRANIVHCMYHSFTYLLTILYLIFYASHTDTFLEKHICRGSTLDGTINFGANRGGYQQGCPPTWLTRGSGGSSWVPPVGSGAEPWLETHFGVFLRPNNAPFCTYILMLWVHQTVFRVTFGGARLRFGGNLPPPPFSPPQHRTTPLVIVWSISLLLVIILCVM